MTKKIPVRRRFGVGAVQFLYDRYVGNDAERVREYEEEEFKVAIARRIHELRTRASLTQKGLAKRVGTTVSVISQMEDADYEGPLLFMLKRIAQALGRRLELSFVDARNRRMKIA
jgi:ribosome-binding protein aMBF1 (putative translation factor)